MFENTWKKLLNSSDKLRSYRLFKNIFKFEKYLTHVVNAHDRINLTRFRISCHKLHIETGRYTIPKTPIDDRVCKNCNFNAIEDEKHMLLFCSKYNFDRAELIYKCYNKNIAYINDYNSKFIWLLSNEEESTCRNIAKFISKCFLLRFK